MQNFELTILGCSSATPTSTRNPTAQLLNVAERFFLIDCGEGTQMQLRKFKIKFQRINHIFISHLHGDHYLGLMGLISSMHLLGRNTDLHIYCPAELQEIIEVQFKYSETRLNYNLVYHHHTYNNDELLFEDEKVEVRTVVLNHRIPCCGFIFREKALTGNISKEVIQKYKLSIEEILYLKQGSDLTLENGTIVPNEEIISNKTLPRSYAYCSDTIYDERLIPLIKDVDLLYHEATFLHEMLERAKQTHHTTALQAGMIAQKANVKKLMIGHYSARYKDIEPLVMEARTVFENTIPAVEGEAVVIAAVPVN
ncbi:MAG: ribonuclease [Bacteroidetes bacterium]|jgi:ribonuclease Z|nr:ribonuclease [Bacteroidota bacterium]